MIPSKRRVLICSFCFFATILFIFGISILKQETDYQQETLDSPTCIPNNDSVGKIPHIIHQTWKNSTLPPKFLPLYHELIEHHPDWEYKLWTDQDNDNFVAQHYPSYFPTYQKFEKKIFRIDAVRYLYMYHYGGVYMDLDMRVYRNIGPLIDNAKGVVVARMGSDEEFIHSIPNAWMASPPKNPFWLCLLNEIKEASEKGRYWSRNYWEAEWRTGPIMFKSVVDRYKRKYPSTITILHENAIFAFNWLSNDLICYMGNDLFDMKKCDEKYASVPNKYAISYWSHSWEDRSYLLGTWSFFKFFTGFSQYVEY
jgi:mannosyltransferase OCH1-like enzyme